MRRLQGWISQHGEAQLILGVADVSCSTQDAEVYLAQVPWVSRCSPCRSRCDRALVGGCRWDYGLGRGWTFTRPGSKRGA